MGAELAVAWALVLGLMIGLGLLLTGPLASRLSPDEASFSRFLEDQRTSTLTDLAEVGGTGGDTITIALLAVCVAAAAWAWTRTARPAVFLLVGLAAQAVLYLVAGKVVPRDRPPVKLLDHGLDPSHSFPSGHVCTAVMFWGGCVVLLWVDAARRWRALAVGLALVPLVVALSRLYQGAHFLSDVGASLLLIPLWLAALRVLVLGGGVRSAQSGRRPRGPAVAAR